MYLRLPILAFSLLVPLCPATLLRPDVPQHPPAVLGSNGLHVGEPTNFQKMSFLSRVTQGYTLLAKRRREALLKNYQESESERRAAAASAQSSGTRLALAQTGASSAESAREAERLWGNLESFTGSMSNLLSGVTSPGYGCSEAKCAEHASCTLMTSGPTCLCNEGYIGLGGDCRAPPEFSPHSLIVGDPTNAFQANDIHMCVFDSDKIAVVFRNAGQANAGNIVVGTVRESGLADLLPPSRFTSTDQRSFDPVVAGTNDRFLAVAWRDERRMGSCWLRAASVGPDLSLNWADRVNICVGQAHKMGLVSLPQNRVAVIFSDWGQAIPNAPVETFGNSVLASLNGQGSVTLLGHYRFADHPVCRLEVTKVSPTAFVLAARAGNAVDDLDPSVSSGQQALAVYAEMIDDELVFNPGVVNLDSSPQVWSRGLSLIAPNTFAYAYEDGVDQSIKIATVEIDAATHRMDILQKPAQIDKGVSPYVSMLSAPYMASRPHTLLYYEASNSSMVSLCTWDIAKKNLKGCENSKWLPHRLLSVSGVHLSGGKALLAFSTIPNGEPYYTTFGLSRH